MTLDEAIEQFKYDAECNRADLDLSFAEDNDKVAEWLEELKQYRAIGTVDECREAVEKMKPKRPINRCMFSECPTCGNVEIKDCKHCPDCGQALIL